MPKHVGGLPHICISLYRIIVQMLVKWCCRSKYSVMWSSQAVSWLYNNYQLDALTIIYS